MKREGFWEMWRGRECRVLESMKGFHEDQMGVVLLKGFIYVKSKMVKRNNIKRNVTEFSTAALSSFIPLASQKKRELKNVP